MVAARDLKCGNDVAKMAALGRYEDEFIIYAVSYIEQGRVWHRVSSDQDEIWRFVEACQKEDFYPTLAEKWVNRILVPSGERDNYLLRSKIDMAQRMKRHYPETFLKALQQFAERQNNNTASALLWQWQEELIGCFAREQLDRFATLVQYAYNAKKVARRDYDQLQGWLAHIDKQMEDDVVIKKNFERTFYGIGYATQGKKQYFVNAKKSLVWQKRQQLMSEGTRATPIWQKTYGYDYQPNLMQTKSEFLVYMQEWYDEDYWQRLEQIDSLPSAVAEEAFQDWLNSLSDDCPEQIATAKYYQTCWGV